MDDPDDDNSIPQPIGQIVGDVITALRDRPHRCFIEEGSIVFRDGGGYDILLAHCDTYDKLLAWQLQLSSKQWMTLDLLMQFTIMVCDHHQLPIAR